MIKETYYKYSNPNIGERFFRVKKNKPVLQIINKCQKKKGRANIVGINFIEYKTFISSWGWKKYESKFLKTISKEMFDKAIDRIIKKIKK